MKKMKTFKFKYWNNKTKARESLLFEVVIDDGDILKADKLFKEKTGLDIIKCPWIGCEIVKI